MAYLPALVMLILFAISDMAGSITMSNPVQSPLRSVDPQLGQTRPLVISLQFLQAFSVKYASPTEGPPTSNA